MRDLNRRDQQRAERPRGVQNGGDDGRFAAASESADGEKGEPEERGGLLDGVKSRDGEAGGAAARRL